MCVGKTLSMARLSTDDETHVTKAEVRISELQNNRVRHRGQRGECFDFDADRIEWPGWSGSVRMESLASRF